MIIRLSETPEWPANCRAGILANDPIGSRFPARPASMASFGATTRETVAVLRTSCVAGTLLTRLEAAPMNSPEYGCTLWAAGRAYGASKGPAKNEAMDTEPTRPYSTARLRNSNPLNTISGLRKVNANPRKKLTPRGTYGRNPATSDDTTAHPTNTRYSAGRPGLIDDGSPLRPASRNPKGKRAAAARTPEAASQTQVPEMKPMTEMPVVVHRSMFCDSRRASACWQC